MIWSNSSVRDAVTEEMNSVVIWFSVYIMHLFIITVFYLFV